MTDEAAKVVEGLKHARMSGLYRKYIDPAIALIQAHEATIAERDAEIERLKAAIQKARNDLNAPGHLGGQTPNYVAIDLSNALAPTPPQEPEI